MGKVHISDSDCVTKFYKRVAWFIDMKCLLEHLYFWCPVLATFFHSSSQQQPVCFISSKQRQEVKTQIFLSVFYLPFRLAALHLYLKPGVLYQNLATGFVRPSILIYILISFICKIHSIIFFGAIFDFLHES